MVLGLLYQLQIFWQFFLIELLWLLTGLGLLTQAVTLDISKAFDMIWHVGLLHKVKSYGISGQIFGFISSFLSYRLLLVVVDESLHKNIQLMLDFLSFLFLVLHFSFYMLMTFMMILFVILLSMLLVLLSTLNMVRHLICGNN